jgi:hypothetical protein
MDYPMKTIMQGLAPAGWKTLTTDQSGKKFAQRSSFSHPTLLGRMWQNKGHIKRYRLQQLESCEYAPPKEPNYMHYVQISISANFKGCISTPSLCGSMLS